MGRAAVVGLDTVGVATCAAAVFSMRVAGLLTYDKIIVSPNISAGQDCNVNKLPQKYIISYINI